MADLNSIESRLKKIEWALDDIKDSSDKAATQASRVDDNTSVTNEKLDKIIELLEIIVEK